MNDADASNNEAFMESPNSANLPPQDQASCPFYAVVPHENLAISKLPLLQPAKDKPQETEVPKISEHTASKQEWVAEPDSDKQTLMNHEFQQLLALNEELRSANNGLYEQVEQLKHDLAESEKAVQWHKRRSGVTESMLNQQTQELAAAQEQIKSLFQQLETAVQTVQRQESCIETHKTQLQISQQRLAQLERECGILQTNYSEQSQHLAQSETSCRELRTRLMRQQRQTLQFKAALEKSLETPVPNADCLEDTANCANNTRQTRFSRKARSLFPNAQPIKPWSAEPELSDDDLENSWGQASTPSPFQKSDPVSTPSSPWDWPNRENTTTTSAQLDASSAVDDFLTTPKVSSPLESSNIDEQIDSLIQMFFASQSSSATPVAEPNLDSNQVDDVLVWETLATTIADEQEPETAPEGHFPEDINPSTTASDIWVEKVTLPLANKSVISSALPLSETTPLVDIEDYWSEISQLTPPEFPTINLPQDSLGEDHTDPNSPSPVVYPQRPPKGRKSFASVELPDFRQNRQ
jgi:myosin heavy subunit